MEWVGPGAYTLKEGGNYIKYASDGNFQSAEMWPTGKYMVMTMETATKPAGLWVKALEKCLFTRLQNKVRNTKG